MTTSRPISSCIRTASRMHWSRIRANSSSSPLPPPIRASLESVPQRRRSQQAADMLGAKTVGGRLDGCSSLKPVPSRGWAMGVIYREFRRAVGLSSRSGNSLDGRMIATVPVDREALRGQTAPRFAVRACAHSTQFGRIPIEASSGSIGKEVGATMPRWSATRARSFARARPGSSGDRVAIMGDACEEWMICDLAAQSLGRHRVGIYPTASVSELAYQVLDGGAGDVHCGRAGIRP